MGSIGVPELLVVLMLVVLWLLPIVGAVWLLVTVKTIRASQVAMERKLEMLAQSLKRT